MSGERGAVCRSMYVRDVNGEGEVLPRSRLILPAKNTALDVMMLQCLTYPTVLSPAPVGFIRSLWALQHLYPKPK